MEFNFRGWDAQMEHMYHHTPVKEGLWSGTSLGRGQGVLGIYPRSVDMREAIQRELEKERIREEILAEEIARRRVLEAEVRREMAMEMAIHGPSSSMLKPSLSHTNRLEPGMPRGQPFAPVSLEEKHGDSGRRHRSRRNTVGKPTGVTLSGAKGKSAAAAGSSEWRCAVCKVSAPCENGFNEHLAGKKHQAQMATLKANKADQRHGAQQKTCKTQSLSPSISGDGINKLKNTSSEIGLGVAPKKSTTMESNVLQSNKSVKKNSSKCVSIDSKKEDKKSEGEVTAPKISTTMESNVLQSNKSVKKNSSKWVSIDDSKKEDKKSEGEGTAPKKSTTMESNVLQSNKSVKKNSSKCVSIDDSKKEDKKSEGEGRKQQFLFSCEMCNVGAPSDKAMQVHIKGKKHLKNLVKLHQESVTKKAHIFVEKHKLETMGGLEKVIGDKDRKHGKTTSCRE